MPPSNKQTAADRDKHQWVLATWIPHTTLSQTSQVCLKIRSAHVIKLDALHGFDWRIRTSLYCLANTKMVPVDFSTTSRTMIRKRSRTITYSTHEAAFDTVLQLPLRWRDVPRDAYLLFEILSSNQVVYRATLPFFSKFGRLQTGLHKLKLQSSPLQVNDTNYGLHHDEDTEDDPVWKAIQTLDELQKIEKRTAQQFGQVPAVPWLDQMLKKRSEQIINDASAEPTDPVLLHKEGDAHLIVELPSFDIPIMHEETFYPTPVEGACGPVAPVDLVNVKSIVGYHHQSNMETLDDLGLLPFLDYENETDNPVEDKYRTLAHDLLRGLVDPALKPDREQRHKLAQIIDSPSHHPTREEKDLLWRFRFSLVDNRRALTKFLVAVDWSVESEVVQAAELLEQWRKRSPIEVTDALKLLGKHVAFQTNLVRDYAIDTLANAPDSELRLYLLQLVQALKYENIEPTGPQVSSLATFLISRAAGNVQLANYLYWYLKVELEDPTYGSRYRDVLAALEARLRRVAFSMSGLHDAHSDDAARPFKSIVDSVSKLGSQLKKLEQSIHSDRDKSKKSNKTRSMWDVLVEQDSFISGILSIQHDCRDFRGKKDAKEAELKSQLSKEGFHKKQNREAVPLPSNPSVFVSGVNPESASMFKSALYPALIEFNVEGTLEPAAKHETQSTQHLSRTERLKQIIGDDRLTSYKVIVKTGDDLRQDQLIIMMIQLMDRLLKRAALDLCLTPYSIIATSPNSGLVEFVDGAMPISGVLSKCNNSILQFFQAAAPQKGAKYDIKPEVMSTYVRSCAGYAVLTYLLGVGDRHLDNILLRATGHFFHIDFGFIFGRDPKPLPPAFRLTREMVDGMGGTESAEYRQFCSLACQAFNTLRKSAGLLLNLLHLMSDANIEDLSNNPSANSEGVLAKVEERFRLDLTDEQAERFFVGLINDCLAAIAPRVMDVFHSIAVARR